MPFVSLADARAPLTLALDAGTSSVRALSFDAVGEAIAESEEQIPYTIDTTADGGATFPANALFELTVRAIDGAIKRLGDRATEVAAVGSTSFWHSLLGIDADGAPTTPVLYWADTRSAAEAHEMRATLDANAVWQRTGCRLHPSYWPAKLRWLRRVESDAFQRTVCWLSYPEFALGRLCSGEAGAATVCMASGTGLLDVHSLGWDEQMLEVSGIDIDQLSPLVDLGPPGQLRTDFARRWPALAGAEWFPALGDGACANVGSGAIGPSRIALTIGTSAAMRLILPRDASAEWNVPSGLWAYRLDSQRAVLGGALSNGGNFLRWIWNTTGTGPENEATVAASGLSPDTTGLTFLPFLAGERSPGWYDDASGVFAGLTLSTQPQHLIRAGMESVAYRLAEIYDALRPLADTEHDVVTSGGAILSMPAWQEIIADTFGHSLVAIDPNDETTARGAALMAAVGAGIMPSLEDGSDVTKTATTCCPNREHFAAYQAGRKRQADLEAILFKAGAFV
jgi:gluconokinase